jgi:hypothetical protein
MSNNPNGLFQNPETNTSRARSADGTGRCRRDVGIEHGLAESQNIFFGIFFSFCRRPGLVGESRHPDCRQAILDIQSARRNRENQADEILALFFNHLFAPSSLILGAFPAGGAHPSRWSPLIPAL